MRFLLDVNVLVALAFPDHQLNTRAHAWFRRESGREWATCALTQAGFLRQACRVLGGSRAAIREALAGLERDCQNSYHEYWPVDTDLRELSASVRSRLIGPNQTTDMQLLMLAHRQKGQLAMFDRGLRELAAGTRYSNSLLVL